MANTDVSSQLGTAGLAFGDLIALTGKAVAASQQRLNETAAATTSALAKTVVPIVAIEETVYDDEGRVTGHNTFVQSLPLLDLIDPVGYEWSEVRIQGKFNALQFESSSAATADASTGGQSTDHHQLGFRLGGLFANFQYDVTSVGSTTSSHTELDRNTEMSSSVGLMRMNATLEPRHDIGVPKPRQVIVGPEIAVDLGAVALVGNPATARTMEVTITYTRDQGSTAIADKTLSIQVAGLTWDYASGTATDADGAAVTDSNGRIRILLHRDLATPGTDAAPSDWVVSVRKGILSNTTVVTL